MSSSSPTPTDNSSSNATPSSTQAALASISAAIATLNSEQAALASASAAITGTNPTPPSYKIIGVVLALVSGLFIGSSFVFKKKGLLNSQHKVIQKGGEAGESHAYLKSPMWWVGMSLMIVGEICNFVAYAFADAILVTPMGALSVVICAVLSSIFLKERLSFFGKIGCFLCIVGATIIALNGPQEQAVSTIPELQKLFLAPGFLVFASVIIIAALGLIFYAAPKWGKTNMLVYISVCSVIGGLSVVSTQGLGASIITTIKGESQFKYWFMYFLIGFVICTLLTEINYLNKALELFNTAMVTPTYYVMFTFFTLLTSIILFQGLKAPVGEILTLVLGFLVICAGITLLQMSKIDPTQIVPGLDRKSSLLFAADKDPESESGLAAEEPGVDGLRGFGGLVGTIHRNSLIARGSTASSLRAIHERNMTRRRRDDSVVAQSSSCHTEDGVGPLGLKRHTLWDSPMQDIHRGISSSSCREPTPAPEDVRLNVMGKMRSPSLNGGRSLSPQQDRQTTRGVSRSSRPLNGGNSQAPDMSRRSHGTMSPYHERLELGFSGREYEQEETLGGIEMKEGMEEKGREEEKKNEIGFMKTNNHRMNLKKKTGIKPKENLENREEERERLVRGEPGRSGTNSSNGSSSLENLEIEDAEFGRIILHQSNNDVHS